MKFIGFIEIKSVLTVLILMISFVTAAQNFETVSVTGVVSGDNTDDALYIVTSSIPNLTRVRAQRINGQPGVFVQDGDDIRYASQSAATGIPANRSRIRFSFLESDGVTLVAVNDFRLKINDIDGIDNEGLATNCDSGVRFTATADPTNIIVDNVLPNLSAIGSASETGTAPSRVMYEFDDVNVIEFENFANSGFVKDFDMNDQLDINTPLYSVCDKDTDSDGYLNSVDLDDDNDGISDIDESGGFEPDGDNDGDGLPNYLDTEDNTGDSATYIANADGSATNYIDVNGNGTPDIYENTDGDGDGVPNHLDLDSDNDGCSDANEAYNDPNADGGDGGEYGVGVPPNTNSDGTVTAATYSGTNSTVLTPDADIDGDGSVGVCDIDDDGDGNPDTTDPNPLVATTNSDSATVVAGNSVTVDVLANDDFQPSANTAVVDTGNGSGNGTVLFNSLGQLIYTPLASEAGSVVTVEYQVCNTGTSPIICVSEIVSIMVNAAPLDSDNDGIIDSVDLDDDNDGVLDENELKCSDSPSGFIDIGSTFPNDNVSNPGSQSGLYVFEGVSVNLTYELLNNANWNSGVGTANNGGVSGTYINFQPDGTNFPASAMYPDDAGSIDVALYTFDVVSDLIYNVEFKWGGLDNNDRVDFIAQYNGVEVPVKLSVINALDTGIVIQGQSAVSSEAGSNAPNNSILVSVNGPVDKLIVVAGKEDGAGSNVTMQFYEFSYCVVKDTDGDAIPDHLDLDSDNDGCDDVLESGGTDNDNDGVLGDSATVVDENGQVTTGSGDTTGGYNGASGDETVATQVIVDTAPADQSVVLGDDVTFSVTVTATSTLDFMGFAPSTEPDYSGSSMVDVTGTTQYQWFEGDPASGGTLLTGETNASLTITPGSGDDGSQYCVVITHPDNVCFTQTECATLTVVQPADPCDAIASGNPDNDGDGISNFCDLDDDNDGILDTEECGVPLLATNLTGIGTNTIDGEYIADLFTADFNLTSPSMPEGVTGTPAPVEINQFTSGVTDGLMVIWDEGYVNPGSVFDMTLTIDNVQGGQITNIRIASNAPSSNYGAQNANKELTLTWNGGGTGVLYDPLNEIVNLPSGAIVSSGDLLDYEAGGLRIENSQWYLDVDLSSTTFPFVLDYNTVSSVLTRNEGFAFIPTGCRDTDNDGTIDSLDLDSDNDLCNDVLESGGLDPNGDGRLGALPTIVNSDGLVTGSSPATGGYDGANGNEIIATQVNVAAMQPTDQTATTGESATFTIATTADNSTGFTVGVPDYGTPGNANAGVNYMWYIGDPDTSGTLITAADSNYSGENTDTLTVNDVTGLDGTEYFVVVSHDDNVCFTETRSATLTIAQSDVSIDKVLVDSSPYSVGDTVTYTLTVSNAGPDEATNVVVTDIPENLTITNISGGGCTMLPCTIASIAAGAGNDVVITLSATIDSEGAFSNGATVVADQDDPDTTNNQDLSTEANNQGTVPSVDPIAQNDISAPSVPGDTVSVDPTADNGNGADQDPDGVLDVTTVSLVVPAGATMVQTDADGDVIGYTVPGEGAWEVNPVNGEISFAPEAGFNDDPTNPATYTIDDNAGNTSNQATVTIDYVPVATADEISGVMPGDAAVIDVLANDVDGDLVDPTTVMIIDPANPGVPVTSLVEPGVGVWSVDPVSGAITFTPCSAAGIPDASCTGLFEGSPMDISYVVSDNQGNVTAPAKISATYAVPPVAQDDESLANVPGATVSVDPTADNGNGVDADPDGVLDVTTVSLVVPVGATMEILDADGDIIGYTVPGEGAWEISETTGQISFIPEAGFNDDPTSPASYTIDDNDGNVSNAATVTIDYVPVATPDVS
ncbi:MAG: hypothetical protein ABJD45_12465, partial [Nonlabens sp.]